MTGSLKVVVIASALFCLVALLVGGDLYAQKPTKVLTGTVKRAEVYKGKVRAVYIEDPQEGEFLVVRGTEVGKELLKHVGATVRATGYVRKPRPETEFELAIDVLNYEIVPSEDEPAAAETKTQREEE
jgi:hypothetical protein